MYRAISLARLSRSVNISIVISGDVFINVELKRYSVMALTRTTRSVVKGRAHKVDTRPIRS